MEWVKVNDGHYKADTPEGLVELKQNNTIMWRCKGKQFKNTYIYAFSFEDIKERAEKFLNLAYPGMFALMEAVRLANEKYQKGIKDAYRPSTYYIQEIVLKHK